MTAKVINDTPWWRGRHVTCEGCGRTYEIDSESDLKPTKRATPANPSRGIESRFEYSYWFDCEACGARTKVER